jgi:hypothetical protein
MNTPKQNEYLLLFHGKEWWKTLSPEELQQTMDKFKSWFDGLTEEGKLKAAQPLARDGAIVSRNGQVVADGPFAESKEAIGGYFLLQVGSLGDAIAVARSFPGLDHGTRIEVRPVAEECPMAARAREIIPEGELEAVHA